MWRLCVCGGLLAVLLRSTVAAVPVPGPPDLPVKAYLLVDYHSGTVLAEKQAGLVLPPASLTKLMTVYVVGEYLQQGAITMDDMAEISERAWQTGGSKMFIEVGTQVRLEDLLRGVIIQSGNDASVALAEHIAGSEAAFAGLMNATARRLGMTESSFRNSTGLGEQGHYVAARDLITLAMALIRDHPQLYAMHSEREFTFNRIHQRNRNRLLWQQEGVDGIKTGHTDAAGYCLVASAERDGMRLVSVVMGAANEAARDQASRTLLAHGFNLYETRLVLAAGDRTLAEQRVWKGYKSTVAIGTLQDLHITVPRGTPELQPHVRLDRHIIAPVAAGQSVAVLELNTVDGVAHGFPLVALDTVEAGSVLSRMYDSIWLFFFR